ncbi:glycosyltransferase [Panacibacter sp. DH6]|uniref:Glycosyltransferase n=1 Tax=Panacibacter microcysteis TaxID=2793269 RepID=A0A931MDI4_9BACT|nr:glycosyltransferase [Panacibacter microcysteis]MBG9378383.1 glycosyltransferase [Panacibacter microcysteis]
MQNVIIIGPAHPLRGGGLSSFNERLARAHQEAGDRVTIYTFSLQYPGFLFPGTSQYSSEPAPADLNIKVRINSVNPLNWISVGNEIKALQPDIVIVRYWLPFMGPSLGTILRRIKRNKHTKIIAIADNVIPHESRPGDKQFTAYFIKPVDAFITMSEKVMKDLRLFTQKKAVLVPHPLYDNFGNQVSKSAARQHLHINESDNIILFFGFIRRYKGLDMLLQAMAILKNDPRAKQIRLLVAGEFYEDRKTYDDIIQQNDLAGQLILRTDFIADSEVKYYLSAADFVIQPYRNATQSGVTPLAYHFEKPMLVTNVGGLPDLVPDGKAGLIAEPNPADIASHILKLYELGEDHFLPHLRSEKKKYSWSVLVDTIKNLTTD